MVLIIPGEFSTQSGVQISLQPERSEQVIHWRFRWIRTDIKDGPSFEGQYPGRDDMPYEAGYELTVSSMGYRTRVEGEPQLVIGVPGRIELKCWTSDDGTGSFIEDPQDCVETTYNLI